MPLVAKRLLALVAAAALVVGAFVIRSRMDDSSAGGPDSTGPTASGAGPTDPPASGSIVCVTELQSVCAGLAGVTTAVEPAATTADRLVASGSTSGVAAWVTLDGWPQLVDEARQRAGRDPVFATDAITPIAATPLVIVARKDRAAVLAGCPAAPTWACLGDASGKAWSDVGGQASWGAVKTGMSDARTTASGNAAFAAAVANWFAAKGTAAVDLSSSDFDDDAFQTWVKRLVRAMPAAPNGRTPLEQMLVLPASYDAVGALGADADRLLTAPGRRDQFTSTATGASAVAVTASFGRGPVAGSLRDALVTGLTAVGWTKADTTTVSGLPAPGVLDALRTLWKGLQ